MKKVIAASVGVLILLSGAWYASSFYKQEQQVDFVEEDTLAAKFALLSSQGNSSCSSLFTDSIDEMPDTAQLQGSCCSQMDFHRYSEQIEGLKEYDSVPEIPKDPYNINAGLAKKLKANYYVDLIPEAQAAFDYAMVNSDEKGPCCCKCWRWHVYGGLAKLLIQKYGFSGEQVTQVWNLSDGCGGAGDHLYS